MSIKKFKPVIVDEPIESKTAEEFRDYLRSIMKASNEKVIDKDEYK